ncbi:MAG TPA: DUF5715 family protein [Edaphobacter sp.]|nr:DUF5715 family protein [Edaphobacter sp.]
MLWRSAPLEIMMRSNAPIQAFLALAALLFLPAPLHAKPAHHSSAHKTTVADPPKKNIHKKSADEATASPSTHKSRHHRGKTPQSSPANIQQVRSSHRKASAANNPTSKTATSDKEPDTATNEPATQKATSADFIKAASGHVDASEASPEAPHVDKALAIKTPPAESDDAVLNSHPARTKSISPEKPVPVLNAIRKTTERPQLEPVEEAASTPVILPALYNKRGHLIVPPPLKGSHEILVRQNQVADRDGLDRIQNDDDLEDMRSKRLLVAVPTNTTLQVDERLPSNRRYCRPWTAQFLATLSRVHYARFHTPLQVNSAVRTVEFQQRLLRTNGNAAPAEGETASPHLTGQAIDLAKHGLSLTEIAWLRGYLLPLVQEGKVDVEEEFQQACFHISVYKKYLPATNVPRRNIATTHGSGSAALAAAIH